MSTEGHVVPLTLITALLVRLALSDDLLLYLKPSMRPWLLTAALALGAITLGWVAARRSGDANPPKQHDHAHPTSQLRWLLALPLAAFIVVPRAPLGAFAATRHTAQPPAPLTEADRATYPPLPPPVDGAHEMTLSQFLSYAHHDPERQLDGPTVRLTGFVTPAQAGETGFQLTRFMLSCCAADGTPVSIAVQGTNPPHPPTDTWLVVEGRWRPHPTGNEPDTPTIDATSTREIPRPANPYEAWTP